MGTIRYYPASRVKTNLRTTGNAYTLNGAAYVGPYYLTYKGEAYTGTNPASGPSELLTPIAGGVSVVQTKKSKFAIPQTSRDRIQRGYDRSTSLMQAEANAILKQPNPHYPVVLDVDYQKGYITRYFAKKVFMQSTIIEISVVDYEIITNKTNKEYEDYEVVSMFWQVKGPKNDQRVSQYQVNSGVYDTNKRITEKTAKGFNGLVEFIGGDYTKYAKLTD